MEKAGTYYFVLHFKDSHVDKYKDHKVKPALELNAFWETNLIEVEIDGALLIDGNPKFIEDGTKKPAKTAYRCFVKEGHIMVPLKLLGNTLLAEVVENIEKSEDSRL